MKTITVWGLSFPSRTGKNNDYFLTLPSLGVDLSHCWLLLLVAEHLLLLMMIGSNSKVANSNISVRMGHQEQFIAGHEQRPSGRQLPVGEFDGGRVKHRSSSRQEGSHQKFAKVGLHEGKSWNQVPYLRNIFFREIFFIFFKVLCSTQLHLPPLCRRMLGSNSELLRLWQWQSDVLSHSARSESERCDIVKQSCTM